MVQPKVVADQGKTKQQAHQTTMVQTKFGGPR